MLCPTVIAHAVIGKLLWLRVGRDQADSKPIAVVVLKVKEMRIRFFDEATGEFTSANIPLLEAPSSESKPVKAVH